MTKNRECSICARQSIDALVRHPIVNAPVCRDCYDAVCKEIDHYAEEEIKKASANEVTCTDTLDNTHDYCGWCLLGGDLYVCDHCPHTFCRSCLEKISLDFFDSVLNADTWKCLVCDPSPMER